MRIRWLAALLGGLWVGCGGSGPTHVVVISIDSLRADHLGSYGYDRATSPNIDRLASDGTLFEQAQSSTTWTLPAHAALFTGLVGSLHGVLDHAHSLSKDLPTLAERFAAAGWATGAVVSGPYLHPRYGLARGFDDYLNCMSFLDEAFQAKGIGELNRASHGDENGACVLRRATQWLSDHRDGPAFLFVHFWDVHFDYAPPVPWEKRFDPNYVGDMNGRNFLRNPAIRRKMDPRDLEHLIALYDGEIGYTDVLVGRLLDQLDAQGIGSSTLVVLTSDHGDAFFEHGVKGHQQDLHVEALRIPLLFRGPGVPRGVRRPGPASIIDVAPTLLELTGLEAPGPPAVGRGVSLVEAMRDPTVLDDRWVFAELRCCGHWDTAVVGRDTKIVRDRLTDSLQVYDLKQDPGERRPRAPTIEESGRINGTLWGLKRHAPNFPAADKIGPPAAELGEQLRALGYAE